MAAGLLIAGVVLWGVAGGAGIVVALVGAERLVAILPPLLIDAGALAGAIVALSSAALTIAAGHLVIGLAVRRRHRWAMSAGILLAGTLAVSFVGLAAAAATSAAAGTLPLPAASAGAVGAGLVAAAYVLVGARLIASVRAGAAG